MSILRSAVQKRYVLEQTSDVPGTAVTHWPGATSPIRTGQNYRAPEVDNTHDNERSNFGVYAGDRL
ncbi:hypothetical protein D1872_290120 [compost metagenome]